MTPQVAAATADRGDPAWSLEAGLAAAARGHGMMFVALPAPVVPVTAVLAAWPASAPAVVWSSGELALVGLGVAHELRGTGDARWAEIVAGARQFHPATPAFSGALPLGAATPAFAGALPLCADRAIVGGAAVPASALGFARPRFVGGAAFAPGTADAAPWTGFGDAWFALPRWTYVHDGAHAWLVLAVLPADAADARWTAEHATLRAALDAPTHGKLQPPMREAVRGDAATWRAQVTDITDAIARGEFAKIVAARTCVVTLDGDARPADLLAALDERHAECARVLVRPPGGGALIAATPERLVRRDGAEVACDALAGTIERGGDGQADALRASGKDRREHDLVVRAIAGALAAVGADVALPAEPGVRTLRHALHLHTPIRATLREPRHLLELAARLHPTPAVGGTPTREAVAWIAAHEPTPRGWYAAPVGWFDLDGNGELAVAIRSGVLAGPRVHLWAGAGIVAGSDPDRELAETDVKLRAMLGALGAPA